VTTVLVPTILGLCAGLAAWLFGAYPAFSDPAAASAFGGTVASISTTMLGFLLAALAVLASISHTQLLSAMRERGHYRDLLNTLLIGFVFFLVCALSGLAILFGLSLMHWFACALVGLHVSAFASLLDIGRKLWLVLRNLK